MARMGLETGGSPTQEALAAGKVEIDGKERKIVSATRKTELGKQN